jgi:hypothetical protein
MTTCIYLENILGGGQPVKLIEDFGDYSVSRNLQPGESARLIVSPFKSVWAEKLPVAGVPLLPPRKLRLAATSWLRSPAAGGPPQLKLSQP